MKLHLGCFDQILPGWINTDITPHIFVARVPALPYLLYSAHLISKDRYLQHRQGVFHKVSYLDVRKRFPHGDETFDCVYCSHLLEHLYPQQAESCLREAYRVLRFGGIVRIAVPDLDEMVAKYDPRAPEVFLEMIFEAKQRREKNKHHWHYNELSLSALLQRVGFVAVTRCAFRQGRCPDVDLVEIRPESLFMEGVKMDIYRRVIKHSA